MFIATGDEKEIEQVESFLSKWLLYVGLFILPPEMVIC